MGKWLPLESDEKEKCMNIKTLTHVASRRTIKVKGMRKVLWDKSTCVEEIIIGAVARSWMMTYLIKNDDYIFVYKKNFSAF
jgi:hypothetical protein